MLAQVLNSVILVHLWTVMWYIALIPSTETSLMIAASSVTSHAKLGDIKWEHWLKILNRSPILADSCNGSALSVWLLCVKVMVSMTLFTATSCDFGILDRVFDYLTKEEFYHIDGWWNVITLFDLFGHLKWYGTCRELTIVMIILPGLVRIVDFLAVSELVIGVTFTFHTSVMEMWSTGSMWILSYLLVLLGNGNQLMSSPWISHIWFWQERCCWSHLPWSSNMYLVYHYFVF